MPSASREKHFRFLGLVMFFAMSCGVVGEIDEVWQKQSSKSLQKHPLYK
jgi:hypothetical protein